MGWLVTDFDSSEPFYVEALARSYYMMQQLQQQYAFSEPQVIEYADRTGKFLTPSEAIATGALAEGHLHVVYENGTEVWVNRASAGDLDRHRSVRRDARVAGFGMAGDQRQKPFPRRIRQPLRASRR